MDEVAKDLAKLSWDDAIAMLDANFSFRSLPNKDGEFAYRLSPNGVALSIRKIQAEIIAELPTRIDGLKALATGNAGLLAQYRILTVND